jgi:hypothetical protein
MALSDCLLYLGTDDGLRVLSVADEAVTVLERALEDRPVRDVAVDPANPDRAWAACGLGGHGLHRTTDGGATVDPACLTDRWVWGIDRLPDGYLYAGTEPPGLFRIRDGEAVELTGIHDVAGREDWRFGYEPYEAGHVHGLAAHPRRPQRLFAAVEIGGILVSDDGGDTWRARRQGADVHLLAVAPGDPDRAWAATESGVLETRDGGETWAVVEQTDGLYVKYVAVRPDSSVYALAAPDMGATDVGLFVRDGDVDESGARDDTAADAAWTRRTTRADTSVLAFAAVDDTLLVQAAGDRGRLRYSDDGGRSWTAVGPELPRIRVIAPAGAPG